MSDRRMKPGARNGSPAARGGSRQGWPSLWEAWPLVMLVVFLFSWTWDKYKAQEEAPIHGAAALVDRTPPKVPNWEKPPRGVEDVLKDLARGDCWTASARLRGLRKSQLDSEELRILEGAAFVCAGNGKAAAAAVDPLIQLDFRGDATWIRANAALLNGSVEEAKRLLQQILERDLSYRRSAEALLIRINTL